MRRAVLINDLSGIGRSSLTVALPIVSVCGYECAVLPTAILSNHTGFDSYTFFDFTEHMRNYIGCWEKLGPDFDAVYSGFLGSPEQADITLELISRFGKNALKLVDPVLGDDGLLYGTCSDEKMCTHMRRLVRAADIITPNLTELCALCSQPYPMAPVSVEYITKMCEKTGVGAVVVTGLESQTLREVPSGRISNLIYNSGKVELTENKSFNVRFCGTGDVFASVLCAKAADGMSLTEAVRAAADFTELCVEETYNNGGDRLYGIQFENKLNLLKGCF